MSYRVLLFLSLLPLAVGMEEKLRFAKVLDTEGAVLLRWGFNKADENITIEIQVRTTGWVAFGISPSGGMTGADIVIGGVTLNQTTYFGDYHGLGEFTPVLDTVQNYVLLSLSENGTTTTMRFSRKFRTCDPFDVDVTSNTQRIIAAYGTTDTLAYHGPNRFLASVQLLSETPIADPVPYPSFTYDIKMTNFSVPSDSTTYACAYLPLPQVSGKHHIYKFDSTIQRGNEDLIHHVVLYACPNATNISMAPGICENNPDFFSCTQALAVWSVGGQAFTFPSNAGISLGTNLDSTYVRIEMHYNNLQMQSGRTDSSGIRLYYTPVVRTHDVGVLTTGIAVGLLAFIPPKADSFKLSSICKTERFNQVAGETVPDQQVFAELLHTHLAGRAIQVAQYRNGTQIGSLGRDMSYDFDLQETRNLPAITPIKVGDELVVECTYKTTDRSNVTMGGFSTSEEMCLVFLYYYPRNSISGCISVPDYRSLSSSLGFDIYSNPSALNHLSWTPENIELVQKATKEANQTIILVHFNGSSIQDTGFILNITEPAVAPCNSTESSMPNATNSAGPCQRGHNLSRWRLYLTLFLLSTISVIFSSFLDL